MSEPIIHDSTPKGSALLAYGEARKTPRVALILVAALGVLTLLCASVAVAVGRQTLPLPNGMFLLIHIRAGMGLPEGVPDLWTQAVSKSPHGPVFLGMLRSDDGRTEPFALSLRRPWGSEGRTEGIWRIDATEDAGPFERQPLRSLANSWTDYAASAWVQFWPARARILPGIELSGDLHLGGPIQRRSVRTAVPLPNFPMTDEEVLGQNYVRTSAFPESWPFIETTLRAQGFPLFLEEPPSSLSWSTVGPDETSYRFAFDHPISTGTRALIAAGFGLSDTRAYTLPDGTVLNELRIPSESIESATSHPPLVFEEKTAIWGDPTDIQAQRELPPSCSGIILARFGGHSTSRLLKELGVGTNIDVGQVLFLEDRGKLSVCF
ncbi:hypothetical protein HY479_01915 [Candidatus Uhrbacteria bacterium]|nr:hypothetical protein [Candidatus Uhrbacteria bacterium]